MYSKSTVTSQADVHQNDADFRCVEAIQSGNYSVVTQLINDGSLDPNEVIDARRRVYPRRIYKVSTHSEDGDPALSWSLPQVVGRDRSPEGSTILHEAIAQKNEALVDAILASDRTNPNQKSERGYTPLHYAAIIGNQNIVKSLIKRGANPTLTCNGFKPAELVRQNNKPVKRLLSDESLGDQLLSMLPDFLTKYLSTNKQSISPDLTIPGQGQFGILSKMRAMRERDEVIYGNIIGVCSGGAHIAMFYILSNKRNKQGIIIGQLELEYIMRQVIASSTEDFIEKIELREDERLLVYKLICDIINEMDDHAISTELENLLKSRVIDLELFTKAKRPSEKKSLLFKTKFKLQMALHFSEQSHIELGFRSFMDGVELLQKIYTHPELQHKQRPINFQIANAVFPLLMSPELEALGGLSKPITLTSVFLQKNTTDKNELEIFLKCLRDKFENLEFPIALQSHANRHAIAIFYDPIKKYWLFIDMNCDNPSQPIVTTSDNTEIANHVYKALKFGHEGEQGSNPVKPYLIMSTDIYTSKQHETQLKEQITLLNDNEEFQSLFDVTPFKASATDNNNRTWLDYAKQDGLIETVRRLHQQHVYENQDPTLDIYYAEYMAKTMDQFASYYQQQDGNKNYTYRYELLELAGDLKKLITTESISSKENERLQNKFILEVLKHTPIGQSGAEDEANITQSILSCYAQWAYQGRDVGTLFSNIKLAALIQQAMTNHTDFVININNIVQQDNELTINIRQAIHKLEKAPVDEVSIAFLSDCLITAGKLATTNALNNVPSGVLNKAIADVHKQFQQDRGEIPNEKIYSALNSAAFFEPHATTRKGSDKDSEPIGSPFFKK